MTLTDLANHICAQSGMNDTDDVSAAKMFLQRRLEMIWNSQLWRASLIEATMTLNPDGTSTLGNTAWIPSRATLLLPPEFGEVLAVRMDSHSMNVASLESYYRTDTDWLDMKGEPFEFQVLSPAVWEFATAQEIYALATNAADVKFPVAVRYSPDGVAVGVATESPLSGTLGADIGSALRVISISKAATTGAFALQYASYPSYQVGVNDSGLATGSVVKGGDGNYYQLTAPGVSSNLLGGFAVTGALNGKPTYVQHPLYTMQWDGNQWSIYASNVGLIYFSTQNVATPDLVTVWQNGPNNIGTGDASGLSFFVGTATYAAPPSANWTLFALPSIAIPTTAGALPQRQRLRLTVQPQLAVNLRVLGKTICPVLGDYDTVPINNAEPCLMAFARGDMLLRARQNGKAQLASQEGAGLLAALARSEAFQSTSNFRIVPDNGFGGDNIIVQPNSLHPL